MGADKHESELIFYRSNFSVISLDRSNIPANIKAMLLVSTLFSALNIFCLHTDEDLIKWGFPEDVW